eukprot:CAMPEP_0202849668 /NCGR_PEP_ID=MMETSP1389-20130828/81442_1 /ASSEMBLY_ACC=CAM_ASM_000865 /TAXON_ID=302021 /ORGANISM="Rhodomonas sp., Strain CCMP768" /LENGTH=179 /DNA_ID=CAMNT_0049527725 /DNA_START=81 /DNA_END=620 /DNA_ORIENTATION=+
MWERFVQQTLNSNLNTSETGPPTPVGGSEIETPLNATELLGEYVLLNFVAGCVRTSWNHFRATDSPDNRTSWLAIDNDRCFVPSRVARSATSGSKVEVPPALQAAGHSGGPEQWEALMTSLPCHRWSARIRQRLSDLALEAAPLAAVRGWSMSLLSVKGVEEAEERLRRAAAIVASCKE